MSDEAKLTTEDVSARLHGLTEILTVLARQYPKEEPEQLCAMLRGCIDTLDQLGQLWPNATDAELAMAARELQAGDKAPDLLRMALAGLGRDGEKGAQRVPFAAS